MSKKRKNATSVDMSWMKELTTLAKKAKTRKGNRDLNKAYSYPQELIRDGTDIKWKPFFFKIHKVRPKSKKAMDILEVDKNTRKRKKGAKPVYVRIGTQPIDLIETSNMKNKTFYCECYSVTKMDDGENHLFLWNIEDLEERERKQKEEVERSRKKMRLLHAQRSKIPRAKLEKMMKRMKRKKMKKGKMKKIG